MIKLKGEDMSFKKRNKNEEKEEYMKKNNELEQDFINLVIGVIEHVESIKELEEELGNKITPTALQEITKQLVIMKKKSTARIRIYASQGELSLVLEEQMKQQHLKEILKKFENMKNNNLTENDTKEQETSKKPADKVTEKRKWIITEMNNINIWPDAKAKELIEKYQTTSLAKDRLSILNELESLYRNYLLIISQERKEELEKLYQVINSRNNGIRKKRKLITQKTIFHELNTKDYKPLQEDLKELIEQNRKVYRMIEDIKKLEAIETKLIKKNIKLEITDKELIENRQFIRPKNEIERQYQTILKKVASGKYIEEYGKQLQGSIPEDIKSLLESMPKELAKNELEELVILAVDIMKNKRMKIKSGISSENDLERYFLKNLVKEFIKIYPKEIYIESNTSAYYDILEVLMQSDRNYEYIKKLLDIKEFQIARKKQSEKNTKANIEDIKNEHILLLVLDNFIDNYKVKLHNQDESYINPVFYKEIIKLFLKKDIKLFQAEERKYNEKIEEFKEFVKNKGYQNTPLALKDIEEIYIDNVRNKNSLDQNLKKDQEESFQDQQERYQFYLKEAVAENKRKKYKEYYPNETIKTFQIEGIEPYAFSIQNIEDKKVIAVHLLDTSKIRKYDIFAQAEEEKMTYSFPTFTQEETYPTISIQTSIEKGRKISGVKITPANIKIASYYKKEEIETKMSKEEKESITTWLNLVSEKWDISSKNQSTKDVITNYLSKLLSTNFDKYNLPFIYKSPLKDQEELILENHNATCMILSRIPKKEAHHIFDILDSRTIDSYYIPEQTEESIIQLNPNTRAGVYLLDTLNKIAEETYDPEIAQTEIIDLLSLYNKERDYMPEVISKKNERKVNQMIRQYKKSTAI